MKTEILSVANPSAALKRLRLERELRTEYLWTMKDGTHIMVRSMSDEHLDATIAMLERIDNENDIIRENQAEVF